MADSTLIDIDDVAVIERGGGIRTTPLITHHNHPGARFTTGMTVFPPGEGAPMHCHNCDEQVTLLDGAGICEIDGVTTALKRHDTTYIPAGIMHRFHNTGAAPMRILWIYSSALVTRTFADSGVEVEHLSAADVMK